MDEVEGAADGTVMYKVSIIADEKERVSKLSVGLASRGFFCSVTSSDDKSVEMIVVQSPDLVMVAVGDVTLAETRLMKRMKQEANLPLIALLSIDGLDFLDAHPSVDDFVVEPWRTEEVIARAKRVLTRTAAPSDKDPITSGDLVIDPGSREVIFRRRRVDLTFREYELLAFMAANKRKAFSREDLLHAVWGFEYYGGDRTVDVHVRRLRSKCGESCIETVRNVGYRFRDG